MTTISDLALSRRAARILRKARIATTNGLCRRSPHALLALDGFGRTCLEEVQTALAARGLSLAADAPPAKPESVHLPPVAFTTDLRAIIRQRMAGLGLSAEDVAGATGIPLATIESIVDGTGDAYMDKLPLLFRALRLRVEPAIGDDIRAIIRERARALAAALPPDPRAGDYRWRVWAEQVAPAWSISTERAVEVLVKTFGDRPNRNLNISKLGPLFDVLGLRVVAEK